MQIITPQDAGTPAFTGDDNGGDADDLAGVKDRRSKPLGAPGASDSLIRARLAFEVWRMYFFAFNVCR